MELFKLCTTEIWKSRFRSWPTQNSGNIQSMEFSQKPTLPEIESLVRLAYQEFVNYWLIFCSVMAKIVERRILCSF